MSDLLDPRLGNHVPLCAAWDSIEEFLEDAVDPIMDRANFDLERWMESFMPEPCEESGEYTIWYSTEDYLDTALLAHRLDYLAR